MKLLIVKNITREGPGLLEAVLDEKGIEWELCDLDAGDALPDIESCSAVVVLGGPDSANDDTPKIRAELDWIRRALRARLPYLGICLGMQLLVKASGGSVFRNEVAEIGWRGPDGSQFEFELTDTGRPDPLFGSLGDRLPIFQLHGETVGLTPEMKLLATGRFCRVQAVRVGDNAYGLQGHFELTPEMFNVWLREDADLAKTDPAPLLRDYESVRADYETTGRRLLLNFLDIVSG